MVFIELIIDGIEFLIFGGILWNGEVLAWVLKWGGALGWFAGFSISILMLLLIIEGIKVGVDAVRGEGFKVDKKIIIFLMLIAILATYRPLAKVVWDQTVGISKMVIEKYENLQTSVDKVMNKLKIRRDLKKKLYLKFAENSATLPGKLAAWALAAKNHSPTILEIVTSIILVIIKIIIDVKVAGAFLSFGIVLMVGPFFIPWFFNDEFKSLTTQWFSNIIVYFLEIQIMMFVISFANWVAIRGIEMFLQKKYGFFTVDNMYLMLVFPAFTLAIIFAVSRMTRTLFSSVIGGAEDSTPGMVGAVAGIGLKGAMMSAGMIKGAIGKALYKNPNPSNNRIISLFSSMQKTKAENKIKNRTKPKKGGR